MLGSAKELKRNNRECKGILIGPLMAPRFFDHRDSVTAYFTHCPSRAVGFGLKFCGADGKPTQLREYALTRPRSPAGESFVRDCFDFVQTTQDPDVHGTTSTVTSVNQDLKRITGALSIRVPCIWS